MNAEKIKIGSVVPSEMGKILGDGYNKGKCNREVQMILADKEVTTLICPECGSISIEDGKCVMCGFIDIVFLRKLVSISKGE